MVRAQIWAVSTALPGFAVVRHPIIDPPIFLQALKCSISSLEVDNGFLFQGDMVMSKEQIDLAIEGKDVDNPSGNVAFGLMKSARYKWPNGVVPYVLSDSVSKCVNFLKAYWVSQ